MKKPPYLGLGVAALVAGVATAAAGQALYSTLDTPASQTDVSDLRSRVSAMETGPVAEFPGVKSNAAVGAVAAPYARTKWAGAGLQTDTTGVRTISIPAGKMTIGLVCAVTTRTSGPFAIPTCVATGTPSTGYTVVVSFTKFKTAVVVPAVVVGAAATTLPLLEPMANTGVVTFDISFSEPDVVGP